MDKFQENFQTDRKKNRRAERPKFIGPFLGKAKVPKSNSGPFHFRSSYQRCYIIFDKVAGLQTCNFMKEKLQHRCFSVNIAKFLSTPHLQNILTRLLLSFQLSIKKHSVSHSLFKKATKYHVRCMSQMHKLTNSP